MVCKNDTTLSKIFYNYDTALPKVSRNTQVEYKHILSEFFYTRITLLGIIKGRK